MTAESVVQAQVRLAASKLGYVLWRNNKGKFYGYGIVRTAIKQLLAGNWRAALDTLTKARPVDCGVGPDGAGDLIGYLSVTITPDMVGQQVAVFTSIECKAPGARTKKDHLQRQQDFAARVKERGGIAAIVESADQLQPASTLPLSGSVS